MSESQWVVLEDVSGSGMAEILRGLLEAQGIEVYLSQEGIGESIYPVTVGPLSEVQILVRAEQIDQARALMAEYYSGDLEAQSYSATGQEDDAETADDQG